VDHRSHFVVGERYRHLSGEYEVIAIDDDWVVCRLDNGREARVTTQNAFRVLEQLGRAQGGSREPERRLAHRCEGCPCGPACVKRRQHR